MSPQMRLADNRRTTARVVLIMVVAVMTTLVLFSGGPIGAISFAQQQTTSPGFVIKWVNPDSTSSTEISAKDDDPGPATETAYHLVAWVNSVPSNASVTFQYQEDGDPAPTTIGQATLVGSDTYELFWPGSQMPEDGAYELIAVLTSNTTEVSRDTEDVVVNNDDDSADPVRDFRNDAGETVEILEPANTDGLGFYDAPGGDTTWVASIIVRRSTETRAEGAKLTPYYSISPPGTEPSFKACDNGSQTFAQSDDGIRCELAGSDSPNQVTAVAVVASDQPIPSPAPGDEDSGDGHRVTGYISNPSSVLIQAPASQVPVNSCTPLITSTVFDQGGSRVVGVNVDVHAQDPDSTLAFDDSDDDDDTSDSKAPENHTTETARDCETDPEPADGEQGWHDNGTQDRKHIESLDGTADNGTFTFKLWSATPGTTQMTVWADEDGNDMLCSGEAQGDESVGFGVTPGSPTGVPDEESSCVLPSETTGTPSPSTSSPSPTNTSPSPTSTSSASPTPTETTTPPPPVVAPSKTTINYDGNSFDGKVKSDFKKCRRGRKVIGKKVKPGPDKKIGSDKTDADGDYSILERNADGTYYTVAQKKTFTDSSGRLVTCRKDRSPNEKV